MASGVMLAEVWSGEDPTGWWISEKLDGVRAICRGGDFRSRNNGTWASPESFRAAIPPRCELDGEFWAGRQQFQRVLDAVKSETVSPDSWRCIKFMVFDVLKDEHGNNVEDRPFEERLGIARRICQTIRESAGSQCDSLASVGTVPMERCRSRSHLQELLEEVRRLGGEGLVLRASGSPYRRCRNKSILKVKLWRDEEALVIALEEGSETLAGKCAAMLCKTPDGRHFRIGNGLTELQRASPPAEGTVITYRFAETTEANLPRCPVFLGIRADATWEQCCLSHVPREVPARASSGDAGSILFSGQASEAAAKSTADVERSVGSSVVRMSTKLKRLLSFDDDSEDAPDASSAAAPPPDAKRRHAEPCAADPGPIAESAVAPATSKIVCPYGAKCYRKNPLHFEEYAHPWLEADGDSTTHKTSGSTAAISACPAPVTATISSKCSASPGSKTAGLGSKTIGTTVSSVCPAPVSAAIDSKCTAGFGSKPGGLAASDCTATKSEFPEIGTSAGKPASVTTIGVNGRGEAVSDPVPRVVESAAARTAATTPLAASRPDTKMATAICVSAVGSSSDTRATAPTSYGGNLDCKPSREVSDNLSRSAGVAPAGKSESVSGSVAGSTSSPVASSSVAVDPLSARTAPALGTTPESECYQGQADPRMIAVRNLLRSLSCDAPTPDLREHFGTVLGVLCSGPGKVLLSGTSMPTVAPATSGTSMPALVFSGTSAPVAAPAISLLSDMPLAPQTSVITGEPKSPKQEIRTSEQSAPPSEANVEAQAHAEATQVLPRGVSAAWSRVFGPGSPRQSSPGTYMELEDEADPPAPKTSAELIGKQTAPSSSSSPGACGANAFRGKLALNPVAHTTTAETNNNGWVAGADFAANVSGSAKAWSAVRAVQSVELFSHGQSPNRGEGQGAVARTSPVYVPDVSLNAGGEAIAQLRAMGFSSADAGEALRRTGGEVNRALEWLLGQ